MKLALEQLEPRWCVIHMLDIGFNAYVNDIYTIYAEVGDTVFVEVNARGGRGYSRIEVDLVWDESQLELVDFFYTNLEVIGDPVRTERWPRPDVFAVAIFDAVGPGTSEITIDPTTVTAEVPEGWPVYIYWHNLWIRPVEIFVVEEAPPDPVFPPRPWPAPSPWQNPDNPLDANGDGSTTTSDALAVIQDINQNGIRELSGKPEAIYTDVSGDGAASAIDPLLIINHLNEAES
jgi:hypothetical protein